MPITMITQRIGKVYRRIQLATMLGFAESRAIPYHSHYRALIIQLQLQLQRDSSMILSFRRLRRLIVVFLLQLVVPARFYHTLAQPYPKPNQAALSRQYLLPKLIAVCAITVPGPAPCQCVSPAGMCTTSPTCNLRGSWPLEQINPVPIVTVRICPRSWVCQ
jgi:hypothetical protein